MTLDQFVKNLPRSSLPPKVAHDLDDRSEIADELRNTVNFLIV